MVKRHLHPIMHPPPFLHLSLYVIHLHLRSQQHHHLYHHHFMNLFIHQAEIKELTRSILSMVRVENPKGLV